MITDTDLPADVLAHIHANRKIEAIKLLRENRDLDLKQAKDIIDTYIEKNPHLIIRSPRSETGVGRFILILIIIATLYAIYQYGS